MDAALPTAHEACVRTCLRARGRHMMPLARGCRARSSQLAAASAHACTRGCAQLHAASHEDTPLSIGWLGVGQALGARCTPSAWCGARAVCCCELQVLRAGTVASPGG
jgi:hypothetical protein